jgi:solute carrier family 25 carnitine/acylcarnitine transporter 20/29
VIKTRMQAHDIIAGGGTRTSESESCWRAARGLYTEAAAAGGEGGMRVFWRGFVPTIVRAVPVNMAVFGTFEAVVWAFS